jgi:hypothetical protein
MRTRPIESLPLLVNLDVSGRVLVLQRGRSILTLDTFTRRLRVLAKTASEPIGVGGHGRVRAIEAN